MIGGSGVSFEIVEDIRSHARTEVPQGFVARCRPLAAISLEEAIELVTPSALMVLDHVEDPHNVGAVARSARAAGVPGLVVGDRRSATIGAVAFKAAAGALEYVRICEVKSIADAVSRLKKASAFDGAS